MSGPELRFEPGPLAGRLGPVGGSSSAIVRCPLTVRRGPGAQLSELAEELVLMLAGRELQVGRVRVPAPASLIADLRHPIPVGRRLVAVARGRVAADPVTEALERRALSILPGTLVCSHVSRGQISIGRTVLVRM